MLASILFIMKCLITGAAGFLGVHLTQTLKDQGHEVVGLDNFFHPCKAPDNGTLYADIRYYDEIEKYVEWADIVFHLAAQIHVDRSIRFPQETADINIKGTLNVLEAVRKYNKQMVFASSSEVYGSSQVDYMSEFHQLDGQSPYAASKTAGDRMCKAYFDTFGTKVAILRNFNVFGIWQNDASYGGVIAKFAKAAFKNEPLTIFGDGEQERDYMCVEDAISGYLLLAKAGIYGKGINVGSGKTIKINELAEHIKRITGSQSEIIHVEPRPGEVQRLCADITLAKAIGFVPGTDFEKDLTKYLNWYVKSCA